MMIRMTKMTRITRITQITQITKMTRMTRMTRITKMTEMRGHKIVPDTVANAPKFTMLVTKIQKLVATLATIITLQVSYILLL